MKARIKQLWVEALRSGDFQQGRHWLRKGDRCCCLGVLCELAYEAGVIDEPQKYLKGQPTPLPPGVTYATFSYEGTFAYGRSKAHHLPPPEVLRWAGLRGDDLDIPYLTTLNDQGTSFKRLADIIEQDI